LEYLSLVGCQISTAGAEMIGSGLQKNRSLKTLILRCNRIGDSGGEAIAAGMNLETLDLSSCALGDNSALHLANLLTESTEIRKVLLADNNFHDSAGALIVEATRKNPRLQHVDLA
jgi:Ran GTPase-activating protein (RanGAP) involved in mRNA processing and transport